MRNKNTFKKIILFSLFFIIPNHVFSAGKVYLVIGSDTAIWEGMNVGRYHCTYNQSLYTDPTRNAYTVMNPDFRANMTDSFGQSMKMTWWMMAGNIFRYATNTNVPVPNIMTLYLMKKYHGEEVQINGDELTLHYHTFFWSDYDKDGNYFWNQAKTFLESQDDFKVTLAQFLLEEQVFPVSFRSGWHYMDNDWQHYLDDRVLPYSMHNDYPHKKTSDPEPIDNIYDWSEAPSAFVPYRPLRENYQLPGNGPGWEVRSASFWGTRVNDYMDTVFTAANAGTDQVACFWSHLPQSDFPDNMQMIDSLAHRYAAIYPDVKFRYCTAIEAMQRWRKTTDQTAPKLSFTDEISGNDVYFTISSDETIFQQQPFVAIKDIYENYTVLECTSIGMKQWKTIQPVPFNTLAKAGVTACDTLGNQAMEFIVYLPDETFIDNQDTGYTEIYGNWTQSTAYAWGTDSRMAELTALDSAKVKWSFSVPQTTYYNLFIQFPDIANRAEHITFLISENQAPLDTIQMEGSINAKQWHFLSTVYPEQGSELSVEMSANGSSQSGKILSADVLKITPLVRDKNLNIDEAFIDFGPVSEEDSALYMMHITNTGIHELHISAIISVRQKVSVPYVFPAVIPPMSAVDIPLLITPMGIGTLSDTLNIYSDDPSKPKFSLPVSAEVMYYFHTIDNEDTEEYEEYGEWHTSVANIYGPTSRYAWLNQAPLASARFHTKLKKSGTYEIYEIVPSTVNSTNDALYEIMVNANTKALFHVDQNQGSGNWVLLGKVYLPAERDIELRISDTGHNTNPSGAVLRTDAVRFTFVDEGTGIDESEDREPVYSFRLGQNYPNPFNPQTTIAYTVPFSERGKDGLWVHLTVFNALGQKIRTLVNKRQQPGVYSTVFDAHQLASGVYYYRLEVGSQVSTRKMIVLK